MDGSKSAGGFLPFSELEDNAAFGAED